MPRSAGSETSEKSSSEFSAKLSKSSSLQKQSAVVCTEVFDEHSSPTEDGKYLYVITTGCPDADCKKLFGIERDNASSQFIRVTFNLNDQEFHKIALSSIYSKTFLLYNYAKIM